jgi:hypothetical protein
VSVERTVGERETEIYLGNRGLRFDPHPEITGVESAKRPDFLVHHPSSPFLCEVKDIDSWQIADFLSETPNEARFIPAQLDLGRARSKIFQADRQLNPYAGCYPLVAGLTQKASSDADLGRFAMLELLVGKDTIVLSNEGEVVSQELRPDQYHGLFFRESDRDPSWRFRVGALAAVVVIDEGGGGLEAYLNPRCETMRLNPSVFDGPNDRVLGASDDGLAYGLLSRSGSREG